MKIHIQKSELKSNFTGIYTPDLGQASGRLTLQGLKLYLYLAGNKNGMNWELNPTAYANWMGLDYETKGRTVRKAITDGVGNLMSNGYMEKIGEEKYNFSEHFVPEWEEKSKTGGKKEQTVPKINKEEQIVPENIEKVENTEKPEQFVPFDPNFDF